MFEEIDIAIIDATLLLIKNIIITDSMSAAEKLDKFKAEITYLLEFMNINKSILITVDENEISHASKRGVTVGEMASLLAALENYLLINERPTDENNSFH